MSGPAEETYSTMFGSLRHPARRKILRLLSEKSLTFSQLLDELKIPSSHLTYHLENLGELIVKMEDGKYKLSSIGKASLSLMKGAEEVPNSKKVKFSSFPLRWKSLFVALIVGVLLLSSVSIVQYAAFNQLSSDYGVLKTEFDLLRSSNTSGDRGLGVIRDVFQIDVSKYQETLLSNTVEARSDLGGVVEQVLKYSLESHGGRFDLVLRFRNNHFSLFQLSLIEGLPFYGPIYLELQSTDVLNATRALIQRYKLTTGEPYLDEISSLLATANETEGNQVLGNTKLRITVNGDYTEVLLMYTRDGFDYSAKSLRLLFLKQVLQEFSDDWFFYNVSDAKVNISQDRAIQIARDAASKFSWNAGGVQVSNFTVLAEPVSAVFFPHPREQLLTLVPYWYITLYLDKQYPGGVNSISVGVWADTGVVANIQALSGQAGT